MDLRSYLIKFEDLVNSFDIFFWKLSDYDVDKSAKSMRKLYGILNGRVHNYFDDKPIASTSFQELIIRKIDESLDNNDIRHSAAIFFFFCK